jgi:acyl-CoA synthetase (AMP-forming)/AMP-acid ligase II
MPSTRSLATAAGVVALALGFGLRATGQELAAVEVRIAGAVDASADAAVDLLERAVNINSGTMNFEGVRAVGELFRAELDALDFETEWIDGEEAAPGAPGVLWVRHPALSSGYANRPEATHEQFRDGWFCTRDLFVRDADGFYAHQGRSDELLKVAGQWVQPGDLEEAVLGLPAVAEAACVAAPDVDGFERLALFVAARGVEPHEALAAATAACEQKLPRHKRPKWILPVAELPRTATGMVQRFTLRELLAQEQRRMA